ncbi:MAG: hypothetical protein MMC33_000743 [Icmadophila ericetorum]|nr:hypothetical protein [Icmadophila ericetorum]
MPQWGRPSGARYGRRRQERAQNTRQWEDQRRFEELDSDSDDGEGVGLGLSAGDELQFTGADLGRLRDERDFRQYQYTGSSDESDEEVGMEGSKGAAMQVAMRDKEEDLVQKALERIERARRLGKSNVKLTQAEIDALERKSQKEKGIARKPIPKTRTSGDLRQKKIRPSSSKMVQPQASRRASRSSLNKYELREGPNLAANSPVGFVVAGPDGDPIYAPVGHHPGLPYGSSSRTGSRSASSHSLHQRSTPPLVQTQYRGQPKRYSSVPEQPPAFRAPPSPRPLPDDLHWTPRARSATSSQSYAADSRQYPDFATSVPQYAPQYSQTRVQYPNLRSGGSSSRQRYGPPEFSDSDGDGLYDDDEDDGVEVDVVPYGQGYEDMTSTSRQRRTR